MKLIEDQNRGNYDGKFSLLKKSFASADDEVDDEYGVFMRQRRSFLIGCFPEIRQRIEEKVKKNEETIYYEEN